MTHVDFTDIVRRLQEFMENEARSCSMDELMVHGNSWFTVKD